MTTLTAVAEAFENGKRKFEECMDHDDARRFYADEVFGQGGSSGFKNRLACGDNVSYMLHLLKNEGMAGKLSLIYVDPPFFSGSSYQASIRIRSEKLGVSDVIKTGVYDDRCSGGISEYLSTLTLGFFLMRELLSDEGCIWVHLDRHASHYVKLILDNVFGEENFVNEVIWTYKSGGAGNRSFAKKHDNLLFYGKTGKYHFEPLKEKSYNRQYKPYRFKGVEEFCDDKGWYTLVNMKDVWNIDMVGRTSSERTGYATQKPKKLLERIIGACSREGDICADLFAGSGTFGAVCHDMGRKWIMCDSGRLAEAYQVERLGLAGADFALERPESVMASEESEDAGASGYVRYAADGGKLVLEEYVPGDDGARVVTGSAGAKARSEISRYLRDDSLSLIRCWSVDTGYDGEKHRAREVFPGGTFSCEIGANAGEREKDISLRGYDVFGNRFKGIRRP